MKTSKIVLWENGEYHYPESFGFEPNIMCYFADEEVRPTIIVVPGGGFDFVSCTEAEIIAKEFVKRGYHAAVLSYTTNCLRVTPLKKQPMRDLARAVRILRKNAEELHVNPEEIILCGFSAGSHLCGCGCVHFDDIEDANEKYKDISCRPDAAILSYPVITTGKATHRGSMKAIYGDNPTQEELNYFSVENHVTKQTPPCFIWQTATDRSVSVENSFLMAQALQKKKVTYALHIFSRGSHGLSLSNEDVANENFGEPYTMDQSIRTLQEEEKGSIEMAPEIKKMLLGVIPGERTEFWRPRPIEKEVAVWPEMADQWLQQLFEK